MKPLRVGVIGAGAFASRRHLPALQNDPRVSLTAACRRDPGALARVADHFGIPERFNDWREMLGRADLDGVLIATPHDQHALQARAALERGLHVLLEKPMALTVAEAQDLVTLAQANARCLLVAFNPPYWGHMHVLRDSLQAGRIGRVESAALHWSGSTAAVFGKEPLPEGMPGVVRPTLFRADVAAAGGGNLMDGGGHLLSELLWATGAEPAEVCALMDHAPGDTRAAVTVRLEGDLLATVSLVSDSRYPERRLWSRYEGTAGSLTITGMPFRVTWQGPGGPVELGDAPPDVPSPAQDWVDCIGSGGTPLGSAEHGVRVTRVLTAAYESAVTGRRVILRD
ncbi:MAG: Gfo/Idh/MocA family oxidoreductase [Armatimonadetes bacterium]|nr:Gfo/Idh/MocA family oxidoreductase [Armatimonadota bacterium]